MTVDIFGNHVEVAADEGGSLTLPPEAHLAIEPIHPGEFVLELLGADGVAIGEVDVHDANALDEDFEESGVAIGFIPGERRGDSLDGVARKDGDAVVGFLGDGDALVADALEDVEGKVGPLQLLEQEDVGLAGLKP